MNWLEQVGSCPVWRCANCDEDGTALEVAWSVCSGADPVEIREAALGALAREELPGRLDFNHLAFLNVLISRAYDDSLMPTMCADSGVIGGVELDIARTEYLGVFLAAAVLGPVPAPSADRDS